jgi:molybdopterin/thiamine biosynthesis adenylyltransferase
MAHLLQVGAGSGGMPVLDMLARDWRISKVTLIEPDIYKPHNVERHIFPTEAVGDLKADLAKDWLQQRRPDLQVQLLPCDLLAPESQADIEAAAQIADIGVCAADNESAKFHFDALMRRAGKPWTLGEVLSGGIGGFVHWFTPVGPCYGCVASHLKRAVTVDKPKAPDYSQPGGEVAETTVPAGIAAIHTIASLHALVTLDLLAQGANYAPGFTSMLLPLQRLPDIFDEPFRPYKFRIPRLADCLICRAQHDFATASPEDLDVALDQALARLGND